MLSRAVRAGGVAALLGAGLVGGCASLPLDHDGLKAEGFPAAFAAGLCGAIGRCCGQQSFAFDRAACERSLTAEVETDDHDLDGLRVVFDPAAAAACIRDYQTFTCPELPTPEVDLRRNCADVFRGTVELGQPCARSDECKTQGLDQGRCDAGGTGVCQAALEPHAQPAQSCGGTCRTFADWDHGCESLFVGPDETSDDHTLPRCFTVDGLQCAGKGTARTCQPLIQIGERCVGNSAACVEGAFCNFETTLCEAQSNDGACTVSPDACTHDAICDNANGRCAPVTRVDGATCSKNADCQSGFCNGWSVCQEQFTAAECAGPIVLH